MTKFTLTDFRKTDPNPDQLRAFEKNMDGKKITEEICVSNAELFSWSLVAQAFLPPKGFEAFVIKGTRLWEAWTEKFNEGWAATPEDRLEYKKDLARLFFSEFQKNGARS
ncbi:hypothetical protein GWO43_30305 [candidate division KSB1 bacterium]|nr:hypothetical protein [candidate division KSB1 bacterium]NIV70651.1 hypothetical protein [Phycisphaerae bacterium]NIS28182.1 hypothetical protein [candidate division KSB1 bacterium]NIT75075.1 hypothetical protein [candidate division KSB1 bacterium]NIU28861.1 hypothetical protein [candidate division KSB1 bacterium]